MTQQFRFACTIALLACLASLPAAAAEPDFAACAKPVWPQGVQGAAPEGKLTLHFRVGADGSVLESKVSKSSGVALLDEAAQQGLTHCALAPSSERGAAGAWYPIKWSWTLDGAAGKWRLGDAAPAFADAPPEWRAFFQQTRQADAI